MHRHAVSRFVDGGQQSDDLDLGLLAQPVQRPRAVFGSRRSSSCADALPAAVLVVGVSLLLTGAFHEDGLADTSDALGGGYDVGRVLLILKDSRIGSFGGAALVISIVGRAALLARFEGSIVWALPLAWCGARVGPIWLMATLPYVTAEDGARSRDLTRFPEPLSPISVSATSLAATALKT